MGIDKGQKKPSRFNFIRRTSSRTSESSATQETIADSVEDDSTRDEEETQGDDASNSQDESPRQDSLPIVTESLQEETEQQEIMSPDTVNQEVSDDVEIPDRVASPVEVIESPEDKIKRLQEILQNAIDEKLANIPLRLLDAHTGIMYNSNDLDEIFKESEEYKQLVENLISTSLEDLHHIVDKFFKYSSNAVMYITITSDEL